MVEGILICISIHSVCVNTICLRMSVDIHAWVYMQTCTQILKCNGRAGVLVYIYKRVFVYVILYVERNVIRKVGRTGAGVTLCVIYPYICLCMCECTYVLVLVFLQLNGCVCKQRMCRYMFACQYTSIVYFTVTHLILLGFVAETQK